MRARKMIPVILCVSVIISLFCPYTALAARNHPGYTRITSATSTTAGKVNLKWNKTFNASKYVIYCKKTDTKKWSRIAAVSGKKSRYTHRASGRFPMDPGDKYSYTVRAYNKKSRTYGFYDKKGKSVTITEDYPEVYEDDDLEFVADSGGGQTSDRSAAEADTITVDGVTFDVSKFPSEKTLRRGLTRLSVSWSGKSASPISFSINGGSCQLIHTDDGSHPIKLLDSDADKSQYCVPSWSDSCAYIYENADSNSITLDIYEDYKTGSFPIDLYYGNTLVKTCEVTSPESDPVEVKYRGIVDTIEATYTSDMDDGQKLCAVQGYIYDNFTYSQVHCTGGAKMLLIAARNLGLDAHYRFAGPDYDLYGKKGSAVDSWSHLSCGTVGGHVAIVVDLPDHASPLVIDANGHE